MTTAEIVSSGSTTSSRQYAYYRTYAPKAWGLLGPVGHGKLPESVERGTNKYNMELNHVSGDLNHVQDNLEGQILVKHTKI